MASWVQAIGGIAAIFFAGRYVAKQIAHADTQQRRVQTEAELASVWGCIFAARDAYAALIDLSRKLSGTKDRPPSSSIERIEGLEESIRTLLGSNPHPAAVVSLLTILAELAYSRVAIRECEIEKDREAQALKADARTRKVRKALENLTALYKFLEKSQGA
ncbi:hypothetical protein P353_10065 [Comamonas testosteroni]|uniref:Uncharacterized protein n=2 Tax=Comamonas testosteroni TaxID=285 RepID=A0A096FJP4_COMTE|nr:hypothetical protein P353_10065 [Comamonas testosteroni]